MKIFLIFIVILLFNSCTKQEYLTVEETARRCKVCEDNNLFYEIRTTWNGVKVISVTCKEFRLIAGQRYEYSQENIKKDTLNDKSN